MTRLPLELHRLYVPRSSEELPSADRPSLIDDEGRVRAMALTLARPADWPVLSSVWSAVQSELSLPAPAIAVSGLDGYQLWFSLETAVPLAEARAFLEFLRARHLDHVDPARVGLLPMAEAAAHPEGWHADMLPGKEVLPGQWSAFVAPDLAPIFAECPWLDIPPSAEGQADLLLRLQSIKPEPWGQVLVQAKRALLAASETTVSAAPGTKAAPAPSQPDPRRFLLSVMNDEAVDLALRIEAAKALLACGQRTL